MKNHVNSLLISALQKKNVITRQTMNDAERKAKFVLTKKQTLSANLLKGIASPGMNDQVL